MLPVAPLKALAPHTPLNTAEYLMNISGNCQNKNKFSCYVSWYGSITHKLWGIQRKNGVLVVKMHTREIL